MNLKPAFTPIEEHKTLFNIGATFDIPTGYWITGRYGESILMGGLGPMTAVVGPGNMYKSTITHYMMLKAIARIMLAVMTSASTYDSETNIHILRLKSFIEKIEEFNGRDIIQDGDWVISDAAIYMANEWYSILRDFMKDKRKKAKEIMVELPFNNKKGEVAYEMIPTFSELDSISAMNMDAGEAIMDKGDIGSSDVSIMFMRLGLGKAQMMHEMMGLAAAAKHYLLSTAHIGANTTISSGPGNAPPKKQLQFLPVDTKIKGVTGQFLYNQHNLWLVTNCALLWNKDDKTPLYPKIQGETMADDKDLNIVTLQHTRGKAGPTGFRLEIVVSQHEGVLPSLTEFRFLKESDGFGFNGNDRNYQLALMPEETLQRTTIRMKLDASKKLRRAMNITSELCQMHHFHKGGHGEKLMSAQDLYTKVKDQGYDWNFILDNTRGWWTYTNEKVGDFFLSTMDLINMAHGTYHPYWLDKDKKSIKKEFVRKSK